MRFGHTSYKAALKATIAGVAVMATASTALAGGFEVREQSTHFQGMSFAGAAAGGRSLSSMFWNPAASNYVGSGLTMESNYALILPNSETTITGGALAPLCARGADCSVEIGRDAVVPASYAAIRTGPNTVFGLAINSQFGLGTQPDNRAWAGAIYNTSAKLFSVNATPSISHQIFPGLSVGAGLQLEFFDLQKFQVTAGGVRRNLQGDSVDMGFTLGLNWKPAPGTSIGLGWRSAITHTLKGFAETSTPTNTAIKANIDTPDKVTLSISQDLSPVMRVAATAEWMNWSNAGNQPVLIAANGAYSGSSIDLQWDNGWFFSLGGEYDINNKLTVRAGGAYEISPIQEPSQRLLQLPDADRIWASLGASYKWSDTITLDFAYSHVFVEDSTWSRTTADGNPANRSTGTAESSVDIISVGLKSKW